MAIVPLAALVLVLAILLPEEPLRTRRTGRIGRYARGVATEVRTVDDAELLRRSPDPDAVEAFYRRHVDTVMRYAVRRCAGPEDVADLVSITFLEAIGAARTYDPGAARRGPGCSASPRAASPTTCATTTAARTRSSGSARARRSRPTKPSASRA